MTELSCRHVLRDADRARLRYKAARTHARTNISIPLPYCTSRTSYKAFGKTQPFLISPRGSVHHGRGGSALASRFQRASRHLRQLFSRSSQSPSQQAAGPFRRWITPYPCIGTCGCTCSEQSHGTGREPGSRSARPALAVRSEDNTLYHPEIRQKRRIWVAHAERTTDAKIIKCEYRRKSTNTIFDTRQCRRIQITERINSGGPTIG